MTRDELVEDLQVVQAQKETLYPRSPAMPALLRRERLILDAIEAIDAKKFAVAVTERRYFVVRHLFHFPTEEQARRYVSDDRGMMIVAVDVPLTPTLTGTLVPKDPA